MIMALMSKCRGQRTQAAALPILTGIVLNSFFFFFFGRVVLNSCDCENRCSIIKD